VSSPRSRRAAVVAAVIVAACAAGAIVLTTGAADRSAERDPSLTPAGLARAAAVQDGPSPQNRPDAPRPAPPERISIPAAGIEAVVEPVRARRGVLHVPEVGRAGWFAGGPRPGEAGRAVIIGHLDTRTGPGLFARVPKLPPGATLSVTDRRGAVHDYNVVGGAQVHKDEFPAEDVYGGSVNPVLVLITCGGPFDEDEGYRDNVLVYARPV